MRFLKNIYCLFEDCPAPQALYTCKTVSILFPFKFYVIRWLKTSNVCERAIQMLPFLRTFVSDAEVKISTEVFLAVKEFVINPLLLAKLHFFK